jgi:hypothetical protein
LHNHPGCPGTHSVDQAGLELTEISLPQVLGLKECATTASSEVTLLMDSSLELHHGFWDKALLCSQEPPWIYDIQPLLGKCHHAQLLTAHPLQKLSPWFCFIYLSSHQGPEIGFNIQGTFGSFNSFFFFRDRVSLCRPGCPGPHSVDQAGLELRNPPASASQVLGLKACTTVALWFGSFWTMIFFFNLEKLNIMTGKETWACSISIPLSWWGVVYSIFIRASPSTTVHLCRPLSMPPQYLLEENWLRLCWYLGQEERDHLFCNICA